MIKCEYCGKEHDGTFGSGRFCSKSCSKGFSTKSKRSEINRNLSKKNSGTIYREGKQIQVRTTVDDSDFKKTCEYCGKLLAEVPGLKPSSIRTRKFCSDACYRSFSFEKKMSRRKLKTLQSIVDSGAHPRVRFNRIRSEARQTLIEFGIEKKCCICGFNVVVEVHHIHPVSSFPLSATVSDVNALSNLLYLCPNHHVMADKGLITAEELYKYRYC